MAYEKTEVAVSKSQDGIRKLIMARKGSKIAFISDPPREGFQAEVSIDKAPYQIRIFGEVKLVQTGRTARQAAAALEQEHRRIWRVLYFHLKSVFEAADSGVMEFRELMLPYIVTKSGMTVAECIVPQLAKAIEMNPARMLGGGA
jgi:hypothetical protein